MAAPRVATIFCWLRFSLAYKRKFGPGDVLAPLRVW